MSLLSKGYFVPELITVTSNNSPNGVPIFPQYTNTSVPNDPFEWPILLARHIIDRSRDAMGEGVSSGAGKSPTLKQTTPLQAPRHWRPQNVKDPRRSEYGNVSVGPVMYPMAAGYVSHF